MNLERLKHARAVIAALPAEQIDMETWGTNFNANLLHKTRFKTCGTVGCIMGHVFSTPEAHAQGYDFLRLVEQYDISNGKQEGYMSGWAANVKLTAEYFGIDEARADALIAAETYGDKLDDDYSEENTKDLILEALDDLIAEAQRDAA